MNIKHLVLFFEFLGIDIEGLKEPTIKQREVLQSHFGYHLSVSGEIYYTDNLLVLVGENLNKNWEFYAGLQDATPDCLRRKGLGVYIYYDTTPRVKEIIDVLKVTI
jgi:hypothetical protein